MRENLKTPLWIAGFGFIGAILRYVIKNISFFSYADFPWATLFVNILGAFLMSYVIKKFVVTQKWKPNLGIGITVGFFGSLTTFSTLAKELFLFIQQKAIFNFTLYLLVTVVFGFAAAYLGSKCAMKPKKKANGCN